jgi:two-component system cell cycle response regulator DivK
MPEKKKILIVEDDPGSLKLQKGILEYAGYEVIAAGNAESGISLAKEKLPDLIIMDHRLPGMNGEEAFRILMVDEKTKNIPVVFVTASATDEDKKRLEPYHCKTIIKPINTRTFVQEIEEVLNEPRK